VIASADGVALVTAMQYLPVEAWVTAVTDEAFAEERAVDETVPTACGSGRTLLREQRPRSAASGRVADVAARERDVGGAAEEDGVAGSVRRQGCSTFPGTTPALLRTGRPRSPGRAFRPGFTGPALLRKQRPRSAASGRCRRAPASEM